MANTPFRHILWVAWRNLRSKKHKSGLSIMTTISIGGVSIGVAALIIVLSVMGGFSDNLLNKFLIGSPHIEIVAKENAMLGFSRDSITEAQIREVIPEVTKIAPFVKTDVVLKNRKHMVSSQLLGVDTEYDNDLWLFSRKLVLGAMQDLNAMYDSESIEFLDDNASAAPHEAGRSKQLPGIMIGEAISNNLSVTVGEEIEIISPNTDVGEILDGANLVSRFIVVGIFQTGISEIDQKLAVMNIRNARRFMLDYSAELDRLGFVTGMAVNVQKPRFIEPDVLRASLAKFDHLTTVTWKDVNKAVLLALTLEKFTMSAILMLIIVVAAFSISGTIMMTIYYKRTQISLLQSIGLSKKSVRKIYLVHGSLIGGVGIVAGLIFGLGVVGFIDLSKSIPLPEGIYYLEFLPVKYLPLDYFVICLGAWSLSLIAALYPAITASKQNPVSGLR